MLFFDTLHDTQTSSCIKSLQDVFNIAIKKVNFVKNPALNTRLFRKLCSEMNAEHLNLLYYTRNRVRWLSKGNVLARVFEMREELQEFLNRQGKYKLESFYKDNTFISQLSYLVDTFGQLNCLNLKMQRKDTTVIDFMDALNAFVQKLDNWKRKVEMENLQCLRHFHPFLMAIWIRIYHLQYLHILPISKKNF